MQWLHEPVHPASQCDPLPLPQVLSFGYAKGTPFTGSSSDASCSCGQATLALQHKLERMDESMVAQENVALARSLIDLSNNRQSDPAWLDKSMAAFAADCDVVDVPSGATFHGPEGYKRLALFFKEAFPDNRGELTNVFATEDQVTLECTWHWNNTGPLYLPSGALPATGRSGELRCCYVMQIRKGKIVRLHTYYDMMTELEQLGLQSATGQTT